MQIELDLKIISVRKAVIKAYHKMPNRFGAVSLCYETRSILRKTTMDGTILRRLRELREDGICPYKVIDSVHSIYEKV